MKNTVTISIEEHDRLREIEEKLNKIIESKFIKASYNNRVLINVEVAKEENIIKSLIDKNESLSGRCRDLADKKWKLEHEINCIKNPDYKFIKFYFGFYRRVRSFNHHHYLKY